MTSADPPQLKHFAAALLELPEDRREEVARAMCGENPDMLAILLDAVMPSGQKALADRLAALATSSVTAAPSAPHPSTASAEAGRGTQIGAYKLLERLGEGGFGEVYAAEQTSPIKRRVAVKIIKPGMDSRAVVARFEAERQALAMMDHPNIARVLDAGTTPAGRPYFVMELVRGVPITVYCEENRLSPRERIALMIPVCHAIQHAHQKGIIHRDIKPGNVLVTILDGKAVPKVIDFGIAKAISGTSTLTDKTIYTAFRQFIGTPAYMSPEQILQSGVDVDTRSDVYALGVLMYELLSGSLPFDTESLLKEGLDRMQRVVREQDPPKPSTRVMTMDAGKRTTIAAARRLQPDKLGGTLRGEVDWMVMKAVEKDRNRRYQAPSELADDLQRFLSGDAVKASPPSGWYRARKFVRRNRVTVSIAASTFAALLVLLASVAWGLAASRVQERRTRAALLVASTEAEARRIAEGLAVRRAAAANLSLAVELLAGDRPDTAATPLASVPPELRGWEWHHAATIAAGTGRLCTDGSEKILEDNARLIKSLNAAGQTIVGTGGLGVVGTNPGEVMGVSIGDGHWELYGALRGFWGVVNIPKADRVDALRISPDGGTIAARFGNSIDLIRTPHIPGTSPRYVPRQKLFGAPASIIDYGWTPDGNTIVARLEDGQIWRWEVDDSAGEVHLPEQINTVFDAAQSPDGTRYFLGSWGMARAIDARTLAPLWTSSFTGFYIEHIIALSNDRLLAIASADQPEIILLDAHTGNVLNIWSGNPVADLPVASQPPLLTGQVHHAALLQTTSGQSILLAMNDGSLQLLDTKTWSTRTIPRPTSNGSTRKITALSAKTDGTVAIAETITSTRGSSHQLVILDRSLESERVIPIPTPVLAFCWAPSPSRLIAGDTSGTIRVFDTSTNAVLWTGGTPTRSAIGALAWLPAARNSADPRILAAASDGRLIWLDAADGEPLLVRRLNGSVRRLLLSPDGSACFAAPLALLETSRDPSLTIARLLAQRTIDNFNLAPTAAARHDAILQASWPSDAHRQQAIAVNRGMGDDLAKRNSDALVMLQRLPAPAIEPQVLPITTMLTTKRPNSPSFALTHAWALVQSDRFDEADAILNRWRTLAPTKHATPPPELLSLQARIRHRQGKHQEAAELLAAAQSLATTRADDATLNAMLEQATRELQDR